MATDTHPCQVCQHDDRASIDQALINGKSTRAIARDFQIGARPGTPEFVPNHGKVRRHVDQCLGEAFRAVKADNVEAVGLALVIRMKHLDQVVDETLARLREGTPVTDDTGPLLNADGSPMVRYQEPQIMAAVREARRNVETQARLSGALPDGDPDAANEARKALSDPEVRRLSAQIEARMMESTKP